jgi:hypothetical protein
MPIPLNKTALAWCLCASTCLAPTAWAHGDAHQAIPEAQGFKLGAAGVLAGLSAPRQLLSQGLPGYLLQGDPGVDLRGTQLEHGVLQAGYRLSDNWGAQLAVGAHGTDPWHIETAGLQARSTAAATQWTVNLGRISPALGSVITRAGHLDRFGLMPLARQAMTDGDWTQDGAELGLKRPLWGVDSTVHVGVWAGQRFPGSSASQPRPFPSLHLGAQWDGAWGGWALDGFVAQLHPTGRASRITSSNGAHTHVAPVCDASLNGVVCFDGHSRLSGLSAQWSGPDIPVTLKAAMLWRSEQGTLQSVNGLAQYDARNRGDWLEAIWRIHAQWETALRLERLHAQHTLVGSGSGAGLLASESGFGNYKALQRTTAMLGYKLNPLVGLSLEAGRESTQTQAVHFFAARLIVNWDRTFTSANP